MAALALGGYALLVGAGLLMGWVSPDRAYALMALPCLVPVAWYALAFGRSDSGNARGGADLGLLLLAAGWALVAFGLLVKDSVFHNAARAPGSGVDPESAPVATLCFLLAFAALIAGAALSVSAARRSTPS